MKIVTLPGIASIGCLSARGGDKLGGLVEIEMVDEIACVVSDAVVNTLVISLDEMELTGIVVLKVGGVNLDRAITSAANFASPPTDC